MRTSRISTEASRLADALSSPRARRTRNATASISTTALKAKGPQTRPSPPSSSARSEIDDDEAYADNSSGSSLSSVPASDIEDLVSPPPSRKRKRRPSGTASRNIDDSTQKNPSSARAPRSSRNASVQSPVTKKKPAKRQGPRKSASSGTPEGSAVSTVPPANWEEIYDTVKDMRIRNPTAPVDTVGCAELYWRASSARDKRFHTLIALMLSSQTKDTVTAVAMQRLHTELGPDKEDDDPTGDTAPAKDGDGKKEVAAWDHTKQHHPSTLTLENILAVSPTRLNELIGLVGFHNNKTKYIKAAALILRDEFDSDIPSTPEDLMRLPGVGPKMAYLCMSAAWDKHEGIGVDVHVHRITNLWGWQKTKTPEETRKALESWLPKDKWHEINKLLVGLGQTVCLPVGRRCGECDLAGKGLCKGEVKGQAGRAKGSKK